MNALAQPSTPHISLRAAGECSSRMCLFMLLGRYTSLPCSTLSQTWHFKVPSVWSEVGLGPSGAMLSAPPCPPVGSVAREALERGSGRCLGLVAEVGLDGASVG